jgi:hypothetical protein
MADEFRNLAALEQTQSPLKHCTIQDKANILQQIEDRAQRLL